MSRVFICVNGILTNPGDNDGWTDRAVTWLNLHTEAKAEKFEYACGALTRRFQQQDRAVAIGRMFEFYSSAGYDVTFIGHSNGCDLIERVLQLIDPALVRSVHFFSPAADGDILAKALERGRVKAAFLYGSVNDRALRFAHLSRALLGCIGLGYGDLGRRLPEFALQHPAVRVHEDDTATHSSWFTRGAQFESTMQTLLANDRA